MTEPTATELEPLMTAEEVAGVLRKAPGTIRQWVKLKKIPYVRVGGENLFRRADIERWIDDRANGSAA